MLKLGDLFKPGEDFTSVVNAVISGAIALDPDRYFKDENSVFKTIEPDQQFYLNDGELVVYFGLYEIAPYSSGIPEFSVGQDKHKCQPVRQLPVQHRRRARDHAVARSIEPPIDEKHLSEGIGVRR